MYKLFVKNIIPSEGSYSSYYTNDFSSWTGVSPNELPANTYRWSDPFTATYSDSFKLTDDSGKCKFIVNYNNSYGNGRGVSDVIGIRIPVVVGDKYKVILNTYVLTKNGTAANPYLGITYDDNYIGVGRPYNFINVNFRDGVEFIARKNYIVIYFYAQTGDYSADNGVVEYATIDGLSIESKTINYTGDVYTEVDTFYEDLTYSVEEKNYLYRKELSGSLTFVGDEYDKLKDRSEAGLTYLDAYLQQYNYSSEAYETISTGELLLNGKYNINNKICELEYKNLDEYTLIDDGKENLFNWSDFLQTSIRYNYTARLETLLIKISDFSQYPEGAEWKVYPDPCVPPFITIDGGTYIFFFRIKTLGNIWHDSSWTSFQYIDSIAYSYRELTSGEYTNVTANYLEINKIDLNNYDNYQIIAETRNKYIILPDTDYYYEDVYCYTSGIRLHDFFSYTISQLDSSVNVEEEFNANSIDYKFYDDYPELKYGCITTVDGIRFQVEPTEKQLTFAKITEFLANMFHVYWDIITDSGGNKYFHLFRSTDAYKKEGVAVNLSNLYGTNWTEELTEFRYIEEIKPYRISRLINAKNKDFIGLDIDIPQNRKKTNIKQINFPDWNFDVDYIIDDIKNAKGNYSFVNCESASKQQIAVTFPGGSELIHVKGGDTITGDITLSDAGSAGIRLYIVAYSFNQDKVVSTYTIVDIQDINQLTTATFSLDIPYSISGKWIGVDALVPVVAVKFDASWLGTTGTISSINTYLNSSAVAIKSEVGILSSDTRRNMGFSLAHIDRDYTAEMPETTATVNGVSDTVVDKLPDKEQVVINFPLLPKVNSLDYSKFVATDLGYMRVKSHKRKLDGGFDSLSLIEISTGGGIGFMEIESSKYSRIFKVS